MSDLVNKLRSTLSNEPSDDALWERVIAERQDAADEIERLAAEVVRLREALEAAARVIPTTWLDPKLTGPAAVIGEPPYNTADIEALCRSLAAAIRALSQKESTP